MNTAKMSAAEALSRNLPEEVKEVQRQLEIASKRADEIEDYEFSRKHYKELIDKGNQALERALELATQSDHPRAFEAFGILMRSVSDIVDRLMELQHSKKDLEDKKLDKPSAVPALPNSQPRTLTQNNVFVGSPAELQKLIARGNFPG